MPGDVVLSVPADGQPVEDAPAWIEDAEYLDPSLLNGEGRFGIVTSYANLPAITPETCRTTYVVMDAEQVFAARCEMNYDSGGCRHDTWSWEPLASGDTHLLPPTPLERNEAGDATECIVCGEPGRTFAPGFAPMCETCEGGDMMELDIVELPGIGVHDYHYDSDAKMTVIFHVSRWIVGGQVHYAFRTPDPPDAETDTGSSIF